MSTQVPISSRVNAVYLRSGKVVASTGALVSERMAPTGFRSEADQLRAQDRPDDHQKVGEGNSTHDAGERALVVHGGVIRTRGSRQSHGAMTELAISATTAGMSLPFGTPRSTGVVTTGHAACAT